MKLTTVKETKKYLSEVILTVPEFLEKLANMDIEYSIRVKTPDHPEGELVWLGFERDKWVWDAKAGTIRVMVATDDPDERIEVL